MSNRLVRETNRSIGPWNTVSSLAYHVKIISQKAIMSDMPKVVADNNVDAIIERLRALYDQHNIDGMLRYGIVTEKAFGVSIPTLRSIAKELGKDHQLSLDLWSTGWHEARMLAVLTDEKEKVDGSQMEAWVMDFDSWDICDICCGNLFDQTQLSWSKAKDWASRDEEFVKRAGFTLMAALAVHDKKASDRAFIEFFPIIEGAAVDERNYVKKAVNWALRQIGKRNEALNIEAIACAERIKALDHRSARWIASDALRELRSEPVKKRLNHAREKPHA